MKILFLDIDGVLNSANWAKQPGNKITPSPTTGLDSEACKRLEKVINQTGCKIVLSSTWRLHYRRDDINFWLFSNGCPSADIIGKTPTEYDIRGNQIQKWLDENPGVATSFAIVDDDEDMGHLHDKLVRTTWQDGLQDDHVEQLIHLLNKEE